MKATRSTRGILQKTAAVWLTATLLLSACSLGLSPRASATPTRSPTITQTASVVPSVTQTATTTPIPPGSLPVWSTFQAPQYTPATPIPPPFGRIALPDEMRVLLLAGLDENHPFTGRSDAILLVLYHPRLAKASVVSVPPDLFGYLPGYTMQRLSSAYPVGGARLLSQAIEYNLGIRPDDWLIVNQDDFAILVDELGGLSVPIMEAFPGACGDVIYPGVLTMDGGLAACYARLRNGADESARGLRQQMLLRLTFQRLIQGGNLIRLPGIYDLFHNRIDTSLTTTDILNVVPFAIKMGDPSRTASFQIGKNQTSLWQISTQPPASVFLPDRAAIAELIQHAIDFANKPAPQSDVVLTLAAELTISPTPSLTPVPSDTPSITPTPLLSPTASPTPSITPTPSHTPTLTLTPTGTP
jgi:polyisoprenyl-teichoic acid--peptidoglycan teichoic acid transferase